MSSNTVTMIALRGSIAGALLLAGCASTPAPPELVDARRAYTHASDGPARDLVPAQLLAAKQALARAEQSFTDTGDAHQTRDLAYIAQRRAEIADAQATLAADRREKEQAMTDLWRVQAENGARTQAELSAAKQDIASQRQTLAMQDQALSAERHARRTAENEARAALASLEKVAAVKEEARGLVITLNGAVLFATGQSTLLPIAQERLHEVARALQDNPSGSITIEGHTDSTGSAAANEELSRHRAEAVRDYLLTQGIDRDRVKAVGLGSSRPIADNKTPEGRANNRRVEIVIQK